MNTHLLCDGLRAARDYYYSLSAPETREETVGYITFVDGATLPMIVTKPIAKTIPVGPPQTLGELCIELWQEKMKTVNPVHWDYLTDGTRVFCFNFPWVQQKECLDWFRRTLYYRPENHKETNFHFRPVPLGTWWDNQKGSQC
jgi:hypothetical protein